MKAYIVYGDHFRVPGRSTSVHLSRESADRAAGDLVNLLVADIRDDNDSDLGIPDVVDGKDWSGILQRAQVTRVADIADMETLQALEKGEPPYGYGSYEDALAEISECDVWIEEHEIVGGASAVSIAWSEEMARRFTEGMKGALGLSYDDHIRYFGLASTVPSIQPPFDVHQMIVSFEEDGDMRSESVALLVENKIAAAASTIGIDTLAQRAGAVVEARGEGRKVRGVKGNGAVLLKYRKAFRLVAMRDGDINELTLSASNIEEAREAAFHYLCAYFRITVEPFTPGFCEEDWDFLAAECDYCTLEEVA